MLKKKFFSILKWIDWVIVMFTVFASSRLGLSDKLTSIILITGLIFIILISIIEKNIMKEEVRK